MIVLQPQQRDHVARLAGILSQHKCAMDLSVMGAGKTYTASYLAASLGFRHVVVVCPVSVQHKWAEMADEHGVPVAHNISYHKLRAARGRQPTHGLLTRTDVDVEVQGRTLTKVCFAPSGRLESLAAEGVFLIVDEFQHLKNVTAQFEAARTMVRAVGATPAGRCLFLSGSPFDKKEHAVTLLKTLGVMVSDHLTCFKLAAREYTWTGIAEVVDACRKLEGTKGDAKGRSGTVSQLVCHFGVDPPTLAYHLFQRVVKPALTSSMPHPPLAHRVHKCNAMYRMTHAERLLPRLKSGINNLKSACGYDGTNDTVNFAVAGGIDTMAALTQALLEIERCKVPTLAHVARRRLAAHPDLKVVVCVNYRASVEELTAELAEFQPLLLDGRVHRDARAKVISAFQAPDRARRLLIGNVHVCSTGIDLDDKDGRFPRLCLVSPNYSTLTLHQLAHRFLRMNSRGDSEFHMVYVAQAYELPILNALAKKGKVMKETTGDQLEAGVMFPSDFPTVHPTD